MCIGHGIRVAARAFVTFVEVRLKCLLLLLLLLLLQANLKNDRNKPFAHVSECNAVDTEW